MSSDDDLLRSRRRQAARSARSETAAEGTLVQPDSTSARSVRRTSRRRSLREVDVLTPRTRSVPVPTFAAAFPEAEEQLRGVGARSPWITVTRTPQPVGRPRPEDFSDLPADEEDAGEVGEADVDPDQPRTSLFEAVRSRRTLLRTIGGAGLLGAAAIVGSKLIPQSQLGDAAATTALSVRSTRDRQPSPSPVTHDTPTPTPSGVPAFPAGHVLTARSNQAMLDSAGVPSADVARQLRSDTGATIYAGYLNLWSPDDFRMVGSIFEGILPIQGDRSDISTGGGPAGHRRGQETVQTARAAGFIPGTLICVDIEADAFSNTPDQALAYLQEWATVVHAAGYRTCAYSSPRCLKALAAQAGHFFDAAWVGSWFWNSGQGHQLATADADPATQAGLISYWPGRLGWQYASAHAAGVAVDFSVCQPGMRLFSYDNKTVG